MGFFDGEMKDMLDVFLLEAGHFLEKEDEILIRAEQDKKFTAEDINEIFRIMHTMKSSSAMMGLSELSGLYHRLEDLFSLFREEPGRLDGRLQETFDLLFSMNDFVRRELEGMKKEDYRPSQAARQNELVGALLAGMSGGKSVTVRLKFENGCKMENVRAFMTVRQIKDLCSGLSIYPEDVEKNADTVQYIRENGFFIRFTSSQPDRILEKLSRSLFVEQCDVVDSIPRGAEAESMLTETTEHTDQENVTAGAKPETAGRSAGGEAYISVRVNKLDRLQNLAGEMMIAISTLEAEMKELYGRSESEAGYRIERLADELEDLAVAMRMVAFESIVPKIRRTVRDICRKEKKEVTLSVTGQEAEVDKKIVDGIMEPMIHLIRNAIDHGIELPDQREAAGKPRAGRVEIAVENAGGEITVRISDDGQGMDVDKIREKARDKGLFIRPEEEYSRDELLELCMLPGFSTREAAGEFSGRGVGLDVVQKTVEGFGGHVRLTSEPGRGSTVKITLPLTMMIINCILAKAGGWVFALPSRQVLQFVPYRDEKDVLFLQNGKKYWVYEGRSIPVIPLAGFFREEAPSSEENGILVHVQGISREACFLVDEVIEQRSIVEKALPELFGNYFKYYSGVSGCSILGDGTICTLIDPEGLMRIAGKGGHPWGKNT